MKFHNVENASSLDSIRTLPPVLPPILSRIESTKLRDHILRTFPIFSFSIFALVDKSWTKAKGRFAGKKGMTRLREPLSQKMTRRPRRSFSQSFLLFVPRSAGRRHTRETPGGRHPYRFTVSRMLLYKYMYV